jgi:hypothetical protein
MGLRGGFGSELPRIRCPPSQGDLGTHQPQGSFLSCTAGSLPRLSSKKSMHLGTPGIQSHDCSTPFPSVVLAQACCTL